MNDFRMFKTVVTASIIVMVALTGWGSLSHEAQALSPSNEPRGDFRDCFCAGIHSSNQFVAFGLLNQVLDQTTGVYSTEFIVFRALGPTAPAPGTRLPMNFDDITTASVSRLYFMLRTPPSGGGSGWRDGVPSGRGWHIAFLYRLSIVNRDGRNPLRGPVYPTAGHL